MEQIRLNKYLAQCGVCSRREADKLIEAGRVVVNGVTAAMGQTVSAEDEILVNRKLLQGRKKAVVLAYYKPIGVVCTEKDAHADKKITDMIDYPVRVTYAGRLDKDSEGLILLTNDGDLINAMMRGANRHEKEYIVKVDKEITPDFLLKMSQGIYLKELDITTRKCEIVKTGKYTFQMILTQGLNRQIRRMCKALGYQVRSLKRIRIMNIQLDDLKYGDYRELSGEELERLYQATGLQNQVQERNKR
uniref:pseudouridine synthase n=1 Tax=Acetatifactor sp. TaxID=1872090 RepID=UPI0040571688